MFTIGTTKVAEPAKEGIVVTEEPVWAPNTGRTANGTMTGDIIAWKRTVAVTWPPLSFEDTKKIINLIKNAGSFFWVYWTNDVGDSMAGMKCYTSSMPRTIYSLAEGYRRHTGVTITFIEQ